VADNGVELILSKISDNNQITFNYLLHASPQLQGEQTINATIFYRMGADAEESFVASPVTIDEVAVNGFHRVSECLDDNSSIIHNTLFYKGDVTALGVRLIIAENTQFEKSDNAAYKVKQTDISTIELFWNEPPDSPIEFDYILHRTGLISENAVIRSQLLYRIADGRQMETNLYPDPIFFPKCDQFIINASSSEGGKIKPEGLITVNKGDSQTFVIETDEGYKIYGWLVDGEMQYNAPFNQYVFNDIRANHRIMAMFKHIEYQINIEETGDNGTLQSSTGSDTVLHGNNIVFTIIPDTGYEIDQIFINDVATPIPQDGKVEFKNVTDNQQKLAVTFKQKQYEIQVVPDVTNGQIIPTDGNFSVFHGESKTFTFKPNNGFVIGEVKIDGNVITMINNFYTFRNVTSNHTLSVSFVQPEKYTITTQIEGNGQISPQGNIELERGSSQIFTFTPESDSTIKDIIIDGISKGPLKTYILSFVTQPHTIKAIFAKIPTIKITASVNNQCGTIEPSGEITLTKGSNQTFLIKPDDTCIIQDVKVNEESKGNIRVYTFWNVQKDSTIKAFFEAIPIYHKVAITKTEGGTVEPSGTFKVREGDTINLKPEPDKGYTLASVVANNKAIDPPYVIQIKEAYTIVVNFTPDVLAPDSNFTFMQLTQTNPLNVSFKDQSSGVINNWEWDFGDGYKSKDQNPIHVYSIPGDYEVKLTVSGPGGSNTKSLGIKVVKITPPECVVKFISTNTTGPVPFDVQFINQTQECDNVQSWLWDFGDGETSDSSARQITHIYTKAGIYTVTLTANTADGSFSAQKQSYIRIDGRKIQGRVTAGDIYGTDTNVAFSGCTVEVHIRSSATQFPLFVDSVLTDENGQYTITGLPATNLIIVSAWPPINNNQYIGEYYENKSNSFTAIPLSTKTGDIEVNFVLAKVPQLGIKGQIITKDGTGQPDIEVSAFSMSTFNIQTTYSDQYGFYTFTHLKDAKDYRIYAWSADLHSEVYYFLPKGENVGEEAPESSVLSWDLARIVQPSDGYVEKINIILDTQIIGNIKGNVRLKENGKPIRNIWVNAWSDNLKTGNGSMTDQNGNYTIVGLQIPESKNIIDGYIVEIDSSDLYPYQAYNMTDNREFAEKVLPDANEINFYLKTGNALFGHVYNNDNDPVKGVKITTWSISKGTSSNTTTDETGLYSIPNLPPADDYVVCASSDDFPIQYYFNRSKQKNADHVDLTDGNVYNIDFHLDKGAIIQGKVTLENNQNAEGLFVNAWSAIDERLYTEKTDSEGNYRFIGLNAEATDYTIYVWEADYLRAFYSDNGTVHKWEQATGVTPGTFAVPTICNIFLSKGISIQGLVTANGKVIKDVRVEAWNSSNEFFADDISTVDISKAYNYKLTGLPEYDTYEIHFTHALYEAKTITITVTDANVVNVNCALELPGRTISGYIRNLEYNKKVFVKIYRKGSIDIRMKVIVGTDSQEPYEVPYEFTGLKPAKDYILDILPTEQYPYVAHKKIDLTENRNDIHLDLVTDTRSLKGTITFPANASNGETVWIYAWSVILKSENQTTVTYNGEPVINYEIKGLNPSNDYIVSIESNVYKQQYYDNATAYRKAKKVDLTQDQNDINFVLQKGASISGTVQDADGKALPNIRVEVWSDSTSHLGFSNTDSKGHYEIGGLKLTDDYVVYVLYRKSIFYYNTDGIVSKINAATLISTNQLAEGINFKMVETGSISGIVTDANNKRLENVMVIAQSVSTGANNGCLTNKRGSYFIDGLPLNDDYRITATPGSDTNYMAQIKPDISTGSTRVDFSLMTGYSVGGFVQDWSGESISNARVEITSNDIIQPLNCYTGDSGEFLIAGIPEGVYYFLVMAPDNSQLIDHFEKGFLIDNNKFGKLVTLNPASIIKGTVTLADSIDNSPLSGIMITIFSESNSFWTYAITNQAGYYQFDNIPEATDYVIKNVSDNYLAHVEINRASGETVNFALKPAVLLKGIIINAKTGSGIEGALVEVRYQGTIRDETRTDSNGLFQASSLEGLINGKYAEYVVVAKYSGYPDVQALWTANQSDLLVIKMSRGDQNVIKGFVFDKNGTIPPDDIDVYVQYYFEQDRKGYIGTIQCSDDGSFSVNGLSPDRNYHLKIIAKYKKSQKKFWLGNNFAPDSKRQNAMAISPGQEAISFKFDSAW
jgi:PKD repeat protein